MTVPPIVPAWIGNLSDLGIAREATQGTVVAATDYVGILSESLAVDPGLLSPEMMIGSRSVDTTPIYGEQKTEGQITLPLFPDAGLRLFGGLWGQDYVTGTGGTSATTLSAAAAVGATSVTLTSATGYVANDYIQLGPVTEGGPSEVHKIASVATNTVTFVAGESLTNAYASTTPTTVVTAPFTHAFNPANGFLPSFTIEKALAAQESIQFAGMVVGKGAFKLKTNTWAEVDYDLTGMTSALINPTAPAIPTSTQPFALANIAVSLFGDADYSVDSVDLNVDNQVKAVYSFTSYNSPSVVQATGFKVTGTFTHLLNGTGSGGLAYRTNALAGTSGAMVITLSQSASKQIIFTLPKIVIGKPEEPIKNGSMLTESVPWTAFRDPTTGYEAYATAVNGIWLSQA